MSTSTPGVAWHYTTGDCLIKILRDRQINLEVGVVSSAAEKRCVWFSTSGTYEPTALKALRLEDGTDFPFACAEDQAPYCNGLIRIGVSQDQLRTYAQWRQESGASDLMVEVLHRSAVAAGSDPERDWHVSFSPVPFSDCVALEVSWDGDSWISWEQMAAEQAAAGQLLALGA